MAGTSAYEDPPPCEHRLVTQPDEVAAVRHLDVAEQSRNRDEDIAGTQASRHSHVIDVRTTPPDRRYDARITEDNEMALISADKNDAAGHRRRSESMLESTVLV